MHSSWLVYVSTVRVRTCPVGSPWVVGIKWLFSTKRCVTFVLAVEACDSVHAGYELIVSVKGLHSAGHLRR